MKTRALLLGLLTFACRVKEPKFVEGGIYSVLCEQSNYLVVKVLKVDSVGVHVRVYSNVFAARPNNIDEGKLYLAGIDHKPEEALGMGHIPLAKKSFEQWQPQLVKVVPVRDEELEGYKMWLDAKGGYFDMNSP